MLIDVTMIRNYLENTYAETCLLRRSPRKGPLDLRTVRQA